MDWSSLLAYSSSEVQTREDLTESVYSFMIKNDVARNAEISASPAKLLKIIQIAQAVLKVKGAEAEAAFQELAQHSGQGQRRDSDRDLRDRIVHLEQDLKHREMTAKDLRQEVEENRTRWKRLETENERMEQRVEQYKEQLELQRQTYSSQRDETSDFREVLRKKDKEMNAVLDQIEEVEKERARLEDQLQQVTDHCDLLTQQYEETTKNLNKLQELLQESDHERHQLKGHNQILEQQVVELQQLSAHKSDTDDHILSLVNAKSAEWEGLLASRDAELAECRKLVQQLQQQLAAANMDTDKVSVIKLSHALQEKEQQVQLLRSELQETTSEITQLCNKIEELKQQNDVSYQNSVVSQELNRVQQEQEKLQQLLEVETENRNMAEEQLLSRDDELQELHNKVKQYESGQYGLSEAVAEIKQKKLELSQRDDQIVKLTQMVGELDIQLNTALEENEVLRQRLGVAGEESIDLSELRHKKNMELEQLKKINRDLSQEVHRLEEEKLELRKQMFKLGTPSRRSSQVSISGGQDKQVQVKQLQSLLEKTRADLAAEKAAVALGNKEAAKLRVLLKEKQELDGLHSRHHSGQLYVTSKTPDDNGTSDPGQLRNEVARLNIENSELRTELDHNKQEVLSVNAALEQNKLKMEQLQSELQLLSERESHLKLYQPVSLPQDMSSTTEGTVASLTEHLMQCLQELASSKNTVQQLTAALDKYKTKFAVIISQQGILYREYDEAKKMWQSEKEQLLLEKSEAEEALQQQEAKSSHLLTVQEALSSDPDSSKQKLSEFSRKITVLRVNERSLTRKLTILQTSENALKKENAKLKQDLVELENSIKERLGYLQRYKEAASFKIAGLQGKVAASVPVEEIDKANKFQEEMTMKYAQLLQQQETNLLSSHTINQSQAEVKQLQRQLQVTKQELAAEKNKSIFTQHLLGTSRHQLGQASDDHITSQRIAALEMKELNERQRADLASTQLQHCQILVTKLQERNKELERKCDELTALNLEAQNREQQLRIQLTSSVSREAKESLERRLSDVEHSEAALKLEVLRLKDVAEMAKEQSALLTLQEQLKNNELTSLQQQLLEHQTKSDDKATIGKLHRQVMSLQTSEAVTLQKLEQANAKVKSMEATLLTLERSCDDKEQALIVCRHEAADRVKQLQSTIQELRRQFSGSIPLTLQEKYSSMILKLQEDKIKSDQHLAEARRHKEEVELKVEQLQLQHSRLQEMLSSSRHDRTTAMEQHSTFGGTRSSELQQEQTILNLQEEVKILNSTVRKQEKTIARLEESSLSAVKGNQDPTMISKLRTELLESHQKMLKVDDALKDAHSQLLEKDKELTQLRMLLDNKTLHEAIPNDNLITSQQLNLAQETIDNLKNLVEQKEKAATKYQSLLEQSRQETQLLNKAHKEEVQRLMQQIHTQSDNTFTKLKQAALDTVNMPSPQLPTEQQLARLQELEELLKEQEATIVSLNEKLEFTKASLQAENHALVLKKDKEIKKIQGARDRSLAEKNFQLQQKDTKIVELEQELEVIEGELSAAREQAPSRTMKNMVDKLKTQLATKEKQQKALNEALKQVRADLVEATQNAVKAHAKEHENDRTVQDIIDKQTGDLKAQITTLTSELHKLRERHNTSERDHSIASTELSDLKQELVKRDGQVKALQSSLDTKQAQIDTLSSHKKELERHNEELQQLSRGDLIAELKMRCQALQQELDQHKQQKQEAINGQSSTEKVSAEKVLQWEESKKWQKKVDSLKTKLSDSNKEVESLQKQIRSLKETLERSDREKSYLHKKLQTVQKYPSSRLRTPTTLTNTDDVQSMNQVEELKRQIHQLEEEVVRLNHVIVTNKKSDQHSTEATIQQLEEYIQTLEAQLSVKVPGNNFTIIKSQLQKLQQQLLERERENIQLQFQYEQASVDLPRLQNRVKDLEHYNEVLKQTKQKDNEREHITGNMSGGHRVTELEKVISAMKKVMEKLQDENESLKKSANSKKDLDGFKLKATDYDEPTVPMRQFQKLSKDNDKLKKDLKKETDNCEHLQLKISRLQVENNRLQDEMQKMLLPSSDKPKGNLTIQYEEQLKKLRSELEKKNVMLQEVRNHLQLQHNVKRKY
ncbi:centrosomal protein of 290 kDa-like isoform X3 [Dysidea avara]|uniref:centrosomal protein of 290 kDa-like isoform X3 n=1 Tax=Dysidea avara TaxID=196820 RepID=UPI00332FAA97